MRVTGQMINYYVVCARKLWFFARGLGMEWENENVAIGKLVDETTYVRNCKHIAIDGAINIDFVREGRKLHEIKKSRKMEEADVLQVKYYLYYLKRRGVEGFTAEIDYPLLKKTREVVLTHDDEKEMERVCKEIQAIVDMPTPPGINRKRYCVACAYGELCLI